MKKFFKTFSLICFVLALLFLIIFLHYGIGQDGIKYLISGAPKVFPTNNPPHLITVGTVKYVTLTILFLLLSLTSSSLVRLFEK